MEFCNTYTADITNTGFLFVCPHCSDFISVDHTDINCEQFVHGATVKQNVNNVMEITQFPPHALESDILNITSTANAIKSITIGCGKPYTLTKAGLVSKRAHG